MYGKRKIFRTDGDHPFTYESEAIPKRKTEVELPETLRHLREMERKCLGQYQVYDYPPAAFLKEARAAVDYEDDTAYPWPCRHYFPTYASLTDAELRGYFGWRTRFRKGGTEEAPTTFVFLHIYELLNQVGTENVEDGLRKLRRIDQVYGKRDGVIHGKLVHWIPDYMIYYRLPLSLWTEEEKNLFLPGNDILEVVADADSLAPKDLFALVDTLGKNCLTKSRLYKQNPQWLSYFAAHATMKFIEYCRRHRQNTFWESYVYDETYEWLSLFATAIFVAEPHLPEFTYELTPRCQVSCKGSFFMIKHRVLNERKLVRLRKILRAMDAYLRDKVQFKYPLVVPIEKKYLTRIFDETYEEMLEAQKLEQRRHVHIDLSRLSSIRRDSETTRDKLMTEEERSGHPAAEMLSDVEDAEAPQEVTPAAAEETQREVAVHEVEMPAVQETEQAAEEQTEASDAEPAGKTPGETAEAATAGELPYGLSEDEYHFLQCLLYGRDWHWITGKGLMASLLIDSINEKLYDEFSDTVLTEGDGPELIEDYIEELKGTIKP
ncbi:MAG: TerB N-terminal domain-containing protein [Acidaminococcus sp.]|nr:TerB N-terminal domain-containing protein [Acidaminococcus sp.]MCI2101074.1 TerB N-terminal domain-containing protein [Acidaminococcus sp.]MCI2115475.1 TerB N-terminal domain-containing protein [Acidaminococcus sp.]MCI2117601.1 TerB N-terminal domain-containing protein [Acidaminococcus sp.]